MQLFFRACTSIALALFTAGAPSLAAAQQTESRISGKILDQSKGALPGVTVTVTSKSTGAVRTAITDGDGAYTVTNLAPGVTSPMRNAMRDAPRRRSESDRTGVPGSLGCSATPIAW